MTTNPDRKRPETLEELVPIVADVIEHAQSLQESAEKAVRGISAATAAVADNVKTLVANQVQMAADIEQGVAGKFNIALNGAGARIGQQLASAEKQAETALAKLKTETESAVTTIQNEADRLRDNWWVPAVIGAGVGAVMGAIITGTAVFMVLTRTTG